MDYPDIDIFHTANKGWGLRTMMDLQEGTFVGEYCGEVITKDECEARVKAKAAENNFNLYCATLMGDLVVDAEHYGTYTRFVNHSCAPNCDMQVWRVMGEPRLVIVTNQAVAANKELTYNYGSSFQKSDDEDTGIRMVCQCGAPNCCGVVGGNANKMVGSAKWCKSALGVLEAIKAHKAMTLKKLRNAIRQCPLKRKKK